MTVADVGVVVVTRDRREAVLESLARLTALPQRPRVVLVDNASSDGTAAAVRDAHPGVEVLEPGENLGGAARTLGARALATPVVAFSDDDSWWADDALDRLAAAFAAHPRLGAVAARVLVGDDERLDPTCALMRDSPLGTVAGLGPRVLGFVACGAAVRRDAFLAVGGFHRRFGIGGEETLVAQDLAVAGWDLAYLDGVVAHHHPSTAHARGERDARLERNALWAAWLRRPLGVAVRRTAGTLARTHERDARLALVAAARGSRWLVRERRPLPDSVERQVRRLESVGDV